MLCRVIIGLILSQFENRVPLKPVLAGEGVAVCVWGVQGRGQCCTITLQHMNSPNKTEFAVIVYLRCSSPPLDHHSEFITAAVRYIFLRRE